MRYYFKVDENNIVNEFACCDDELKGYIECTADDAIKGVIGKRWNGSSFEEVPTEEVEVTETTEVTNADLLEVLLAIGEKVGA